ncbi:hypothetical protein ASG22_16515 [Chryseobacterium sp. Leaf405]|uniref:leucine-rich repeat domain-containing protein n=1 Tax=Chryseobacterium sp. Leaf405 TaxID=1736367 RepID=UPI0006F63370|nr:leucine-rich repeat domain-containing protein [Chryseobacterium sp. Leaf405]KQT21015.1 hypothetical protein ASG22_16515 [Chryseobacterium sp. Leaf405]
MKTAAKYAILFILLAFNTYCFAQPGWSEVGGSLNDLTQTDIDECVNSNCQIKYITINCGTDLKKLNILNGLENLALHFDIEKIPDEFSKLDNLKYLIIVSNNLKDVSALGKLKNLSKLSIMNYSEDRIPKGFQFLQNIEELEITGEFKNASGIENMINLKKLKLSSKNLRYLPDFTFQNNIEELELGYIQEKFIFSNLSFLTKLKIFGLFESSIKKFPNTLTKDIEEITIWRAKNLTDIQNIEQSINLEKLYIYFSAIKRLPSSNFLSKIRCIEINGNENLKFQIKNIIVAIVKKFLKMENYKRLLLTAAKKWLVLVRLNLYFPQFRFCSAQ